jgi:hypothetical protein
MTLRKLFPASILIFVLFAGAHFAYAADPAGTSGTVVNPGGTPGTVVNPGGTPGTVVNPGGTPGTVVNPGGTPGSPEGALVNPLKANDLGQLIGDLLSYVVKLGTILLTLMLIYVGFLFVMAQGNDEKLKSARSALVWTVVGGLILLGASAISNAVSATVGALTP